MVTKKIIIILFLCILLLGIATNSIYSTHLNIASLETTEQPQQQSIIIHDCFVWGKCHAYCYRPTMFAGHRSVNIYIGRDLEDVCYDRDGYLIHYSFEHKPGTLTMVCKEANGFHLRKESGFGTLGTRKNMEQYSPFPYYEGFRFYTYYIGIKNFTGIMIPFISLNYRQCSKFIGYASEINIA
jgi:hypothetical protein